MTNCLLYAMSLWWRRMRKGQRVYFTVRKSDMGNFPHFLFGEERRGRLRIISYKPIAPRRRRLPPLFFKGRVAWGDKRPPLLLTTPISESLMAIRIITPATELAVSMDDARAHARANGTDQDSEIRIRVRTLTAEAEHITGRVVINRTYEVTLPRFTDQITLPASPLFQVVSLQYRNEAGATQTLADTEYTVDRSTEPNAIVLMPGASWPTTQQHPEAVTLTAICGYGDTEASTPPEFKGFILAKVREFFAPAGAMESPHLVRILDGIKVYS